VAVSDGSILDRALTPS